MKTIIFACVLGSVFCAIPSTHAQSGKFASTETTPKLVKQVGFRLTDWRTIHGHDAQEAQETLKILRQIGCEVQEANHGNHIDIKFRCPSWKIIKTNDEEKSLQWQEWLMTKKFETVVVNPKEVANLATVKLRLPEWKTIHSHNAAEAKELQQTFELIGCEVSTNNHGNHIDVRLRMTQWNTIGLSNDQAAHIWMNWLKQSGFETQHTHN